MRGISSTAENLTGFLKRTLIHELDDNGTRPIIRIILSGISAHGVRKCYALLVTKFIDTDQCTGRCVECSFIRIFFRRSPAIRGISVQAAAYHPSQPDTFLSACTTVQGGQKSLYCPAYFPFLCEFYVQS